MVHEIVPSGVACGPDVECQSNLYQESFIHVPRCARKMRVDALDVVPL